MALTESQKKQIREACKGDVYERAVYFSKRLYYRNGFNGADFGHIDVVHEAIMKILAETRKWTNPNLGFETYLFGTIQSIYSALAKARAYRAKRQVILEADPQIPFSQTYDDVDDLQKRYEYLKSKDETLAEFFFNAIHLICEQGRKTDSEVAQILGLSPAQVGRNRKAISVIMNEWAVDSQNTARGEKE